MYMKKRRSNLRHSLIVCLFILLPAPFFCVSTGAQLPPLHAVQTEQLRLIYYDEEHYYLIPHVVRCFENSIRYHQDFFDYTPHEEVTIFFNDLDDYGYAGTTTIPNNWLILGIEPFEYVYDTCPTNERMNWVMNHELLHVVASDQATGRDNFFRTIFFGKVAPSDQDPISIFYSYLTNPRRYAPRWYHEGVAVFMETWMAGGIGRSLTGFDEMTFRAMVRDNSYFYDIVGLESEGTAKDFQIGQKSYLYGTRFVSYLAAQHGPEKVIDWIQRGKGSSAYFSGQFKKVFDTSLDDEWSRWIEFEHEWQKTNLDSIRQYPVTPQRVLSQRALGSVSRGFYDPVTRQIYTAVNYPGEFSHIAAINIDTGSIKKICEIPTPALYYVSSLAYDESTSTIFYTTDNGRRWRDLNAVDLKTGKSRVVLKNIRTGNIVFNHKDKSIWGVQHHYGKSRLVRFLPPYNNWEKVEEVFVLNYGTDIFDMDVSPDGKYLTAALADVTGRQRLIRVDMERLLSRDDLFGMFWAYYEVLWEFPKNTPENFVYSPDGRYLYGSSYLTGTSNIFRYDFQQRNIETLSNCEIGYFRPIPISDDSLIVFEYTGDGFLPVMISIQPIEDVAPVRYLGQEVVVRHPIVKDWILPPPSPERINADSLITYSGKYSILRNTGLYSAYPIAEGYKNYAAFGVRLNFMDPVGFNGLNLAASYTPNSRLPENERFHFRFKYQYPLWTISGAYNRADFYDFFGPTKMSRKGYSLAIQYHNYFIDEKPNFLEYNIQLAGYWDLERLPDYQNIAVTFDEFYVGSAELRYEDLRKTIGRVEPEKGLIWSLKSFNSYVRSKMYPLVNANLDYGILLPIDHSSIWLRSSIGYSFGEREESFANFYFGGFGNNWVDHAEIDRYREYYSFPGVELNAIGGINYGKAMLEWTLPPIRFKRLGFPALYSNWVRLALFSSGIVTNIDSEDYRRELVNFGAQMNLKLVIFSFLESTFSLGYAVALEEGVGPEEEFMISLKILK